MSYYDELREAQVKEQARKDWNYVITGFKPLKSSHEVIMQELSEIKAQITELKTLINWRIREDIK